VASHILVAYTTRNGSTAEITVAMAKERENADTAVTVSDMKTISSVRDYPAVVIGAPLLRGWRDRLGNFSRKKRKNQLDFFPYQLFGSAYSPRV
jgi:menaquinone-dependent protoporphyrinogen oxidase